MIKRTIRASVIKSWLLKRDRNSHKGLFGHVLVLAGSRGLGGAAALCTAAALRSGAGLVTLGTPRSLWDRFVKELRWEAMSLPLPDAKGQLSPKAIKDLFNYVKKRGVSTVVVGPGLGLSPGTILFLKSFFKKIDMPVVLDADGLNALATGKFFLMGKSPIVMTPHPGEAARLLGVTTRSVRNGFVEAALKLSRRFKAVCVLKGHRSLVTNGKILWENSTGNPGMASGGMGDILCGIMGGLMEQVSGKSLEDRVFKAAVLGVYLHGLAGDLAVQKKTQPSLLAGDLLEFLPMAFKRTFGKKIV